MGQLLGRKANGTYGVYTAVSLPTSAYQAFLAYLSVFRYVFLAVAIVMLLLSAFVLANFQSASLAMSCQEDAASLALGGSYSFMAARSLCQLFRVCLPSYLLELGLAYIAANSFNSFLSGFFGMAAPYLLYLALPLVVSFVLPLIFLSVISLLPLAKKKKAIAEALRSSFY